MEQVDCEMVKQLFAVNPMDAMKISSQNQPIVVMIIAQVTLMRRIIIMLILEQIQVFMEAIMIQMNLVFNTHDDGCRNADNL